MKIWRESCHEHDNAKNQYRRSHNNVSQKMPGRKIICITMQGFEEFFMQFSFLDAQNDVTLFTLLVTKIAEF